MKFWLWWFDVYITGFENGFEKFAVDLLEIWTVWNEMVKKKSLTTFFVSREKVQLKRGFLIGGFAVFKLNVKLNVN